MRSKRVEFTPPPEFSMPEGVTSGEDFDAVCTFRIGMNGAVCLVQMGDAKMPGYDGSLKESKPGYEDYAKGMTATSGNTGQ
jgi:hypothetical protein